MDTHSPAKLVQEGDLIQLVSPTNKVYLIRLKAEGQLHTHRGIVELMI